MIDKDVENFILKKISTTQENEKGVFGHKLVADAVFAKYRYEIPLVITDEDLKDMILSHSDNYLFKKEYGNLIFMSIFHGDTDIVSKLIKIYKDNGGFKGYLNIYPCRDIIFI